MTATRSAAWLRHRPAPAAPPVRERIDTGIAAVDGLVGGLPRGALTELTGPASAGKTTLVHSCLAAATRRGECTAVVDAADAFDPASAEGNGVALERLLWVRCGGRLEAAFQSADLVLHGGGFRVVCLDLAGVGSRALARVPLAWWFRFRRAAEEHGTALVVVSEIPVVGSRAACRLEFRPAAGRWSGRPPARLLSGMEAAATLLRPGPGAAVKFACPVG